MIDRLQRLVSDVSDVDGAVRMCRSSSAGLFYVETMVDDKILRGEGSSLQLALAALLRARARRAAPNVSFRPLCNGTETCRAYVEDDGACTFARGFYCMHPKASSPDGDK